MVYQMEKESNIIKTVILGMKVILSTVYMKEIDNIPGKMVLII